MNSITTFTENLNTYNVTINKWLIGGMVALTAGVAMTLLSHYSLFNQWVQIPGLRLNGTNEWLVSAGAGALVTLVGVAITSAVLYKTFKKSREGISKNKFAEAYAFYLQHSDKEYVGQQYFIMAEVIDNTNRDLSKFRTYLTQALQGNKESISHLNQKTKKLLDDLVSNTELKLSAAFQEWQEKGQKKLKQHIKNVQLQNQKTELL